MALQLWKTAAQIGEMADEAGEVLGAVAQVAPVHPADLVVLAIGVVVAALRIADLVAGEQQRQALRQQQAGELVAPQLPPECCDRRRSIPTIARERRRPDSRPCQRPKARRRA